MPKTIYMGKTNPKALITVGNVFCTIDGISAHTKSVLDNKLSYFVAGYEFSEAYRKGWYNYKTKKYEKWDGKVHLLKNGKFLTGLLDTARLVLRALSVECDIVDERENVPYGKLIDTSNIETREYQKRVLDACLKHRGGIVQAATGSGKSVMITQLIASTNVKTIVYVIGIDLLYQMQETFEHMLGTEVGIIGDGQADIKDINVCTVWTAANALGKKYDPFDDEDYSRKEKLNAENKDKIAKVIREAEMTIYDECQMLAAKTLQTINLNSKVARYKFGFSGTPYRENNDDLLLEAVCGKIIVEVTASELIKKKFLVKPKISFINVPEYSGDSESYSSIYKEYIVENEDRNKLIIKAATNLLKHDRRVLILVKNIKHGEILLSMLPDDLVVYFVRGSMDSDTRNAVRKEFTEGKIDLIIGSVVYDQGLNLPALNGLILAGGGKSSGRALQRIGRVIRSAPGKKDAIVVDFIDNGKYLIQHSKKRLDTYRKETEFSIKLPKRKNNAGKKKEKKTKPLQKYEEW